LKRIVLLDGGMGRELKRSGAPFRQPEWSALALIEAPEYVSRVHDAFVDAGADVITTNSYAVVPFHLGEALFARDGARLAALAGRLARSSAQQADRPVAVAASLPPACGSYRPDRFDARIARPILATLIEALAPTADYWLGETLSTIAEAELLRELLPREGRPLWLSFTLEDGIAGEVPPRVRSRETVEQATRACVRLAAQAILFNCSQPEVMGPAVSVAARVLAEAPGPAMSIGVYANAFPPQNQSAEANSTLHALREDLSPSEYLRWARTWVDLGASIVGGCCGIGPEHIAVLRSQLVTASTSP
jgi:S-methylmethionine-dependent homocysteine/selenocysteine methylase